MTSESKGVSPEMQPETRAVRQKPLTPESLSALREMLPHVHVTGRCLEALLDEIDHHRAAPACTVEELRAADAEERAANAFLCDRLGEARKERDQAQAELREARAALETAVHRLDALRAYVPAHMLAAYLLDKDAIKGKGV
jgi:hypothetical protein